MAKRAGLYDGYGVYDIRALGAWSMHAYVCLSTF